MSLKSLNPLRLFGAGNRTPIGLDIGDRRVKAVQLERRAGKLHVAAAAVMPRAATTPDAPLTPAEAQSIAALLQRGGFEGHRIVLGAPAAWLIQEVLDLPPRSSGAPIEQLAKMELSRAHRCAPDAFELGCWDLPHHQRNSKTGPVMAIGLAHARSEPVLQQLEAVGLEVHAVDATSSATARSCASRIGAEGTTAVLDVGWGGARLVLIYRGTIVYVRTLSEAGLSPLHANLVRRLEVESDIAEYLLSDAPARTDAAPEIEIPDEANRLIVAHADLLCGELAMSFAYATNHYADGGVHELLLVGGGARLSGLRDRLASTLEVPVTVLSPADLMTCEGPMLRICAAPVLTTAAGLAMFPE